jgi:hypothetical protein
VSPVARGARALSVLTANGLHTRGMRTLTARPALRWLVPLAVLLAVLASYLVVASASAKAPLAEISAQDLLVKVADAKVDGLSGKVVQNADLGIPAIPGGSGSAAGQLTSLLSGSHTMNVWTDGAEKARIAVKHTTRPAGDQADRKAPAGAPQTPQQAAQEILAKLTPTTDVRVDPDVSVAGQDAYDLVLTPLDAASKVKQVRIAVDGANYVPLRVQVFGAAGKPAIDVAYTDVEFGQPSAQMFAFTPPPGTTLDEKAVPERKAPTQKLTPAEKKELEARKAQAEKDTTTVGSGWSTVVVTRLPADAATGNETLQGFTSQLKEVSGTWGKGRELDGTIVTAILTDDGRLAVGAVGGDVVAAALAR